MKHVIVRLLIIVAVTVFSYPTYAQIIWEKSSNNPVLPFWRGNENDPLILKRALEPCVLPKSGGYLMWFSSYANDALFYSPKTSVSLAFSLDGIRWLTYTKNPVLEPGSPGTFDGDGILSSEVIHNGSQFLMYYSGLNGNNIGIGLATSPDGFTWQKYSGNPILTRGSSGSWDAVFAAFPQVIFEQSVYHMWYGGYNGTFSQTGFATSPDGIQWTKYAGNPVLTPGSPGTWEDRGSSVAGIDIKDSLYYMLYRGNNAHEGRVYLGLATSADGIHWSKYSGNPVVSPGNPGQWDAYQLSGATFLFLNSRFHLWYCASGGSSFWEIGYATSDVATSAGETSQKEEIPAEYRLYHTYPNPFNPEAMIKYDVPTPSHVTIKIYNAIGQNVATLVDEQTSPGRYSIVWNAGNVTSGVYWCQMIAGNHSEVRKMMLVK